MSARYDIRPAAQSWAIHSSSRAPQSTQGTRNIEPRVIETETGRMTKCFCIRSEVSAASAVCVCVPEHVSCTTRRLHRPSNTLRHELPAHRRVGRGGQRRQQTGDKPPTVHSIGKINNCAAHRTDKTRWSHSEQQ